MKLPGRRKISSIDGVVHASGTGLGHSAGDKDWRLRVTLQPWRHDGSVVESPLEITRRGSDAALQQLAQMIRPYEWREDDDTPISTSDFDSGLMLTAIAADPDGSVEFWFECGEVFAGHEILVYCTLAGGPTQADLVG